MTAPRERVQNRQIVDVPVPCIWDDIVEFCQLIPQVHISVRIVKQIINVPVSGAHRPGREGRPSWARASADSAAHRSRARSSNHAPEALSARIAEKRVDAPVFQILEKVAPVAKLLLQHEIISREGRFQGACFFGRLRNRRSVFRCHWFFLLARRLRTSSSAPHMNSLFLTSSARIAQKKKTCGERTLVQIR